MNVHRHPPAAAVRALLERAGLPFTDIGDGTEHFFACGSAAAPAGVVGLELLGAEALLRSLAVDPEHQNNGCAGALVAAAENHARAQSARRIYLLTETASGFFERRGYRAVPRESAPERIRQTSEFSSLCPASAVLMCKVLENI